MPSHTSPTDYPFQLPHASQLYLAPTDPLQPPAEGFAFAKYRSYLMQLQFPVTCSSAPCNPRSVQPQASQQWGTWATRKLPLTSTAHSVSRVILSPELPALTLLQGSHPFYSDFRAPCSCSQLCTQHTAHLSPEDNLVSITDSSPLSGSQQL